MPLLTDLSLVKRHLDRDRHWSAYAIGDLAPGYIEHCEWRWLGPDSDALLLIYHGFDPPILFAMGARDDVRRLFEELDVPTVSLHLRPDVLDAMAGVYAPTYTRRMRRMVLLPGALRPVDRAQAALVTPVGPEHSDAVEALYADGHRRGEGPTFFSAEMLRQKSFYGVWENGELIAIAGTHLFSADLGICAIGNVYTRSDRRGRGLGALTTEAVVTHALTNGVSTIVLNVSEQNVTAQRVYERLGFTVYGDFIEGEATRQQ